MAAPWEKYGGAPATAAPADPIIKPADPYKAEDQSLQRDAARRAQEDQVMQREKFQWERERAAKQDAPAAKATEAQAKAAQFLGRLIEAEKQFSAVPDGARDARTMAGQKLHDYLPDLENSLPVALGGNSSERQRADQAARNFIAASLRQESGAAVSAGEFTNQYRIFFPVPGDSPEVIAQKAEARRQAIEGFKLAAGPLAGAAAETAQPDAADARAVKDLGNGRKSYNGVEYFHVKAPDGSDLKFDVPENATRDQINAAAALALQKFKPDGGSDGGDTDPNGGGQDSAAMDAELAKRGYTPSLGNLVASGLFQSGADELAGVGGGLHDLVRGGSFSDGYTRERDLAARATDQARQHYGTTGKVVEFASMLPTLALGAPEIAAGRAGAVTAAKVGAAQSGLVGFNEGRGLNQSAGNALVGAAIGAPGGAAAHMAAPYVGNALAKVAGKVRPARNALVDAEVVAAGERQGIPIRQHDAMPSARNKAAQIDTTPNGGRLMQDARVKDSAAVEGRVERLAGEGAASDPYALGGRVQGAGKRYIEGSRVKKNDLYTKAEQASGGRRVVPTEAIAAVDRNIAELEASGANTNASAISYLKGLREDLSKPDGFSISEFQRLRSGATKKIRGDQGLTASDASRRLGDVVGAFNADAGAQLPGGATAALKKADEFYAQRQEFINGTLKQFMGTKNNPLPAEDAGKRLVSMTNGKGNFDRFASMWGKLSTDEKADVAATVASSLGRKANGDFSVSTLVRSLDPSKGINPRTARLLFGEDGARALQDLRTIASAKAEANAALNNSRTGVTVNEAAGSFKTLMFGALGFGAGGGAGAVAGAASRSIIAKWGEERAARALLNPKFTKWLRNAPKTSNPKAIDAYMTRLGAILPANDNQAFVSALKDAFTRKPVQAAASEEEQRKKR